MNSGFLTKCTRVVDHRPSVELQDGGLKDEPLLAGPVLNFTGPNAVSSLSDLVKGLQSVLAYHGSQDRELFSCCSDLQEECFQAGWRRLLL